MRNLAFAAAWAEREGLDEFGFVLTYVGGWRRASATKAMYDDFRAILLPAVAERVGVITYEEIAGVLRRSGDSEDETLANWIDRRLAEGMADL